jgi:hypothetical protein
MAWFKKKPDLISDRARTLNEEIAQLEAEIHELDSRLQHDQAQPRLRSTAVPQGATITHTLPAEPPRSIGTLAQEPIFEEVDRDPLKPRDETTTTPEHYNELGVRKYDLPALLRRMKNLYHGPSTTNPKLVSYLAAGGIQGLRPLRYEKRVARNRFYALAIFLFVMLLGVILVFVRQHR